MGIVNYNGNNPIKLIIEGGVFSRIKIEDSTNFCVSDFTTDFDSDPGAGIYARSATTVVISGGVATLTNNAPGTSPKYMRTFIQDSSNDFDFRCRITNMDVANGLGDQTCFMFVGTQAGALFDSTSIGCFYGRIDSVNPNRRRFSVIYRRSSNPEIVVYSREETSLGELGSAFVASNVISGNFIRNIRVYRYGNKLRYEWNYGYEANTAIDIVGSFCKKYMNSVEIFVGGSAYGNQNSPFIFGSGTGGKIGLGFGLMKTMGVSGSNPTITMTVDRIDMLPAICIDTTGNYSGADILSVGSNTVNFLSKGREQGLSNISCTVWNSSAGSILKTYSTSEYVETIRSVNGDMRNVTQFLFDNKISYAKTNDLKRDIYIDSVVKNQGNSGNINPDIYCIIPRSKTDTTHSLEINKSGYIEDLFNEDNTDYNVSNQSNPLLRDSNLFFGKNNLPNFMYNDSTYYYGRNAKFNFLDNILITASGGETPIRDQYKAFERDSTSYYIVETVNDGANYIVYTRIFNIFNKVLGPRVRVNTETTINVRWVGFSTRAGSQVAIPFTFSTYKPSPDIMVFSDKHVIAVNCAYPSGTPVKIRIFYESFDNGQTWVYKNNDSYASIQLSTRGLWLPESAENDTVTFKLRNNDNYFFNFFVNGTGSNSNSIFGNYIKKDNLNMNYSIVDYRKFSRLGLDSTVKYVHACFDPIQKRMNLILSTLDGYVEVLKSPKFEFDSIENFDTFATIHTWRSEYIAKPFATNRRAAPYTNFGRSLGAFDSNGDLIIVAPDTNDSTSFAILRTSAMKDELNVMGRFMQGANKISARKDRFLTNMFSDYADNVVISTTSPGSSLQTFMSIAKYGQYTNDPSELDLDEGGIYPETLYPSGLTFDSTTNGILLNVGETCGVQRYGSDINSSLKLLSSDNKSGFVAEFQMFDEAYQEGVAYSKFHTMMYGDKLSATTIEKCYLSLGWNNSEIALVDEIAGIPLNDEALGSDWLSKLRRYKIVVERTSDSSAHAVVYTENLFLSDYDKIVWDKKLQGTVPLRSQAYSLDDQCYFYNESEFAGETIHIAYLYTSRKNSPIHPERNIRLNKIGQKITSRDFTNLQDYNGFPIYDSTTYLHNGLRVAWKGLETFSKDKWNFTFASASDPLNIVAKQPFKTWRSDSDATSCVVACEAQDQGFQFLTGNIAVFAGVNYRRCFIEGHTSSLLDSATVATFRKELFFDIDNGMVKYDTTNYGSSTVLLCPSKNWRPGEHKERFIQFEMCRVDNTAFRHMAFKIDDNSKNTLTINTGSNRFDTTAFSRYFIYDGNNSVILDNTSNLSYWRIRIPPTQSMNSPQPGDETSQGSVYYSRYREVGEFDMGRLSNLLGDHEPDFEVTIQNSVKETKFDNLSSINFEFARPRRIKKIKYNNGEHEDNMKLKQMFLRLYQTNKPVWIFESPIKNPRSFILGRLSNEPEFTEVGDKIQSVSVEIEEIV